MIDAIKRNAGMMVRMAVACLGLAFVVKILGFDANSTAMGLILGIAAVWAGQQFGDD